MKKILRDSANDEFNVRVDPANGDVWLENLGNTLLFDANNDTNDNLSRLIETLVKAQRKQNRKRR